MMGRVVVCECRFCGLRYAPSERGENERHDRMHSAMMARIGDDPDMIVPPSHGWTEDLKRRAWAALDDRDLSIDEQADAFTTIARCHYVRSLGYAAVDGGEEGLARHPRFPEFFRRYVEEGVLAHAVPPTVIRAAALNLIGMDA